MRLQEASKSSKDVKKFSENSKNASREFLEPQDGFGVFQGVL